MDFRQKRRQEANDYVRFGRGDPSWRGGAAAAVVAKESMLYAKRRCYAKMAVYTVRITGWALKRKSWTGL